jgi:hypothetical protein
MDSFEKMIGEAILGTDEDREASERRLGVKMAVMRAMFCKAPGCGRCLDQSSAALIEFWSAHLDRGVHCTGEPDQGLTVVCQRCVEIVKGITIPAPDEIDLKIDTWSGREWHRLETS